MPIKTMAEAINEATSQILAENKDAFLIGEGVPDPKACFGTTKGLQEKYPSQVFDMPVSENGMTGVCVGAAISGMKPMMVHMRVDFLMYAMDQIVNSAAKMHFMYGGQLQCPLIIRAIVGRGWGQGCQHSQHLERMFAMVPGLKVYYPYDAYTAKGLLIKAARGNNPVIFLEHRWLHESKAEVPDEMYECGEEIRTVIPGDRSILAYGYMVTIARKALEFLKNSDVGLEAATRIVDHMRPSFTETKFFAPTPPSQYLTKNHYTSVVDVMKMIDPLCDTREAQEYASRLPHDVPNPDFKGPF